MSTLAADVSVTPYRETIRDDRIFPTTRWVVAGIIPFLVVAFVMLYFFPRNTTELFAWTIRPPMTPMLMGAGYIAGAYFFVRTIGSRQWHHVAVGFLPVTTFASSMGIATILHWDRFNHAHVSFWTWTVLYAITPFIVFGLWYRNRVTDPGTSDPDEVTIPMRVRQMMAVTGAVILGTGILLYLLPGVMMSVWPWQVTPLTARVLGGWFALPGVFGIAIARDPRWSAARYALQSQFIGLVLILIAVARAWGDFRPGSLLTYVFVAGMAGLAIVIAILYVSMESRRRAVRANHATAAP